MPKARAARPFSACAMPLPDAAPFPRGFDRPRRDRPPAVPPAGVAVQRDVRCAVRPAAIGVGGAGRLRGGSGVTGAAGWITADRSSASAVNASRCGRGIGSVCGGAALIGSSDIGSMRGPRRAGAGDCTGMTGASGCSGQEPFDVASGNGIARGSVSAAVRGCGSPPARVSRGAARTIFASTTTSVGPPISTRCSILSRRTRMRRRRESTLA